MPVGLMVQQGSAGLLLRRPARGEPGGKPAASPRQARPTDLQSPMKVASHESTQLPLQATLVGVACRSWEDLMSNY